MTSNLNYTIRTEGQAKIHTLICTVPNIINLLESNIIYMNELRTKKHKGASEESIDSSFRLKISWGVQQFLWQRNDIIEIYFLYPNSVFLKSILTVRLKRFEERSIVIQEYDTVQGNKWQYLATLYKRDNIANIDGRDTLLLSDGSLSLKFQFMITNDIKVDRINVPETQLRSDFENLKVDRSNVPETQLSSDFENLKVDRSNVPETQLSSDFENLKVDRSNVPETQLSSDFENLLNNGMYSDVTMKSVEGNEYKVHKAVLATRSVVLKAHFEHNTIECQTNIVKSPLEAEVLVEVLNFIYSDKAPRVDEIPERLLAAADYYQLSRLKSLCEEALHKRLTVENAIETLQLADLHSAKILKRLTLEFIKDGQAKLITRTEGWTNVKSVELIKTIYEYIMADDMEADI